MNKGRKHEGTRTKKIILLDILSSIMNPILHVLLTFEDRLLSVTQELVNNVHDHGLVNWMVPIAEDYLLGSWVG